VRVFCYNANAMASAPTSFAMFCRQCGYNLYGLPENRCPECGRTFEPNNPKTFFKHSGSLARRRWAKRIVVAVVAFIILAGAAGVSVWYPWHREQAAVKMVRRCGGFLNMKTIGPHWLQTLLGREGGFLLERVDKVHLGNMRLTVTDTDVVAVDGLAQLQSLDLGSTQVTDAGRAVEGSAGIAAAGAWFHAGDGRGFGASEGSQAIARLTSRWHQGDRRGTEIPEEPERIAIVKPWRHKCDRRGTGIPENLNRLQSLAIVQTAVTDAGLEGLKDIKGLRWVNPTGVKVTDAGVAALKRALPNCNVEFNDY